MKEVNSTGRIRPLRTISKVLFALLLLVTVWQFVSYFQVRSQLSGPLIPKQTVDEISRELLYRAAFLTVATIIAAILLYLKKYIWVPTIVIIAWIASRYIYFSNFFYGS